MPQCNFRCHYTALCIILRFITKLLALGWFLPLQLCYMCLFVLSNRCRPSTSPMLMPRLSPCLRTQLQLQQRQLQGCSSPVCQCPVHQVWWDYPTHCQLMGTFLSRRRKVMASFPILWRGRRESYQSQFIRNFPESCGLSHTYLALFYSNSNLIN